ncbi:hypothetical protein HAZT_HAZT002126 [Hyalella azteca]|uniref:Uncharacterized protein n=1 Tax=Hyalella azteca TaxID=294128 RepID=A0A6A0GUI5_HYAAZ|nr:hypothetical protein HAZT_HAZT002126 [Hyalella azteca]
MNMICPTSKKFDVTSASHNDMECHTYGSLLVHGWAGYGASGADTRLPTQGSWNFAAPHRTRLEMHGLCTRQISWRLLGFIHAYYLLMSHAYYLLSHVYHLLMSHAYYLLSHVYHLLMSHAYYLLMSHAYYLLMSHAYYLG